jgi:DNA-binding NtrC family response regulator
VLVVDDEKNIRRTLAMVLEGDGYRVIEAESGEQGSSSSPRRRPIDLAILDLKLPGISGIQVLETAARRRGERDLAGHRVSGHATVQDAVLAIKLGASDFFEKPLNRERVLVSVGNSITRRVLSRAVMKLQAELEARYEMIGTAPAMQRLYKDIDRSRRRGAACSSRARAAPARSSYRAPSNA